MAECESPSKENQEVNPEDSEADLNVDKPSEIISKLPKVEKNFAVEKPFSAIYSDLKISRIHRLYNLSDPVGSLGIRWEDYQKTIFKANPLPVGNPLKEWIRSDLSYPMGENFALKIDILLKPTANAPIMKKKKWSVDPDKKIGMVIEFIKKYLKLDPGETLFLYVNQAFAPSPDQLVRNLYDCYETDGKLILHYCLGQAWG